MLEPNKSNNDNKAFQYFKCAKPLDFSSINLESLEELNGNENLQPLRVHNTPKKNRLNNRYETGLFWLKNNKLKSVNGLRNLADRLLDKADYLFWLDLSSNNLTTISDEFLRFPNLSMLYLHRNKVKDVLEIHKLRQLNKLQALTLKNNPMCDVGECYRSTVVNLLPGLRKLDNVVVVRSERRQTKEQPTSVQRRMAKDKMSLEKLGSSGSADK